MVELIHPRVTEFHMNRTLLDLEDPDFDKFINRLKKHALELFPEDDSDEENPLRDANKYKGDVFEIFGEFLIKYMGTDTRINILNYSPETDNDLGVDGFGIGSNSKPTTVQFKFKGNTYAAQLNLGDLRDFFGLSHSTRYGVPADTPENLVIISTASNFSHKIKQAHPGCRIIGYGQLKFLTHNNPVFWAEFKKAVENSAMKPKKRIVKERYEHQVLASIAIKKLLDGDDERGQVIIPTGGGKTLNELLAVEDCFMNGGQLAIVASPRIALTEQLFKEFYDQKRSNWQALIINSGEDLNVELFFEESKTIYRPTTNVSQIKDEIRKILGEGGNLVIFSTYHSLTNYKKMVGSLGIALSHLASDSESPLIPDLIICDEAHNLTRSEFAPILDYDIAKWLFFTATRRVSYSDGGFGMNNLDKFGEVIYQISPRILIERGMIVPPRLHFIHAGVEDLDGIETIKEEDRADLAMVIAGIQEHIKQVAKFGDDAARLIVFCKSAEQAHDFEECEVIRDMIPELEYVAAVTSKGNRMKDTRRNIFQRYQAAKFSILFHFDVISEGIDLAGTTGVIILRSLKDIKATQGIGRALRIIAMDRNRVRAGELTVGDIKGWGKPFGWVIIPYIDGKSEDTVRKIEEIVTEIRSQDYDIDTEEMVFTDKAERGKKEKPEFDDTGHEDDWESKLESVDMSDIGVILTKVEHEIEEIDRALVSVKNSKMIVTEVDGLFEL